MTVSLVELLVGLYFVGIALDKTVEGIKSNAVKLLYGAVLILLAVWTGHIGLS